MAKSKQPAFRADYVAKLKELGVYDQFVKNWENYDQPLDARELNEQRSFSDFISEAFIWAHTPEGYGLWYKISES